VAAAVLQIKLPQIYLSLSLSAVTAFLWYFFAYDMYLTTAAISNEHYGYFSLINGNIQAINNLTIALLFTLQIPAHTYLIMLFVSLIMSFFYSLLFGWGNTKQLNNASVGYC